MNAKRMLYAPNIHQGGGRALLLPLLRALREDVDTVFVLDARMSLPVDVQLLGKVYRVAPTLVSRLGFEWQLKRLIREDMLVLCMGNLPPLLAHQGQQYVFVQNRYLIDGMSLSAFVLPIRIRLTLERWWLASRVEHVKQFIVQTPSMKRLLENKLHQGAKILPFVARKEVVDSNLYSLTQSRYDFIYIASGEPHKNHIKLIDAWALLAGKGLFPSLCLTFEQRYFPDISEYLTKTKKQYDLNIDNVGHLPEADVEVLYRQAGALIFPSRLESFGIPLIEAREAGLKIIASELDYVRDILDPDESFDPSSAVSIARAVERCMNVDAPRADLLTAEEFLHNLT